MQRQPRGDQLVDQTHAGRRHQNVERLHPSPPFRFRTVAPDVAHAALMTSPDGARPARRRPLVRRLMLRDFRSYAALDLGSRPPRRPMRRERRGQDQSPRSSVAARAGPRPAPGRACRMRAARRRGRLRLLGRGRGGRRDASARLRLEARRDDERRGRAPEPHRPRAGRLVARLQRPCADRLADAGDGFAVRRAGERAAPLSRPLRAGDRSRARRAGQRVRARAARAQPAARRGPAQRRLARRDRARSG